MNAFAKIGLLVAVVGGAAFLFWRGGADGGDASAYRPNILFISVDTLRADHLGCYDYERPTSPFIDSLAADGVVFERCYATAPNTAPSHMSMMTSLYPTAHAVPNAQPTSTEKKIVGLRLPKNTLTLASVLQGAGYRTAGFADGGNVNRFFGLAEGFRVWESKYEGVTEKVDQALAWLRASKQQTDPYFLFLHTYQVHEPYLPPIDVAFKFAEDYDGWIKEYCFDEEGRVKRADLRGFSELFNQRERLKPADVEFLKALYDAELVHTDRELKRLFATMESEGLGDDLLVVFLSDHGEEFDDHGDFGHKQMFDEVTRVPLFFSGHLPWDRAGERVGGAVSILDVMPTLLDMLGLQSPDYIQGRSLVGSLRTGEPVPQRPLFAELVDMTDVPRSTMLYDGGLKFIRTEKSSWLFDLAKDPAEEKTLLGQPDLPTARLREMRARWIEANQKLRTTFGARRTGRQELPPDELRELGY